MHEKVMQKNYAKAYKLLAILAVAQPLLAGRQRAAAGILSRRLLLPLRAHAFLYPSDILAGALLGMAIGLAAYRIGMRRR